MNNNAMTSILIMSLGILFILVFILVVVWFMLNRKDKNKSNLKAKDDETDAKETSTVNKSYNKQSIFKFMNFDKIEDNMIIQNNGKRMSRY